MDDTVRTEDAVVSGVRVQIARADALKVLVSYAGVSAAFSPVAAGDAFVSSVRAQAAYSVDPYVPSVRSRNPVIVSFTPVFA